ncbi:MAG: hypothetical protein ACYC0H_07910 [Solirubrobacteraceae bacterium]
METFTAPDDGADDEAAAALLVAEALPDDELDAELPHAATASATPTIAAPARSLVLVIFCSGCLWLVAVARRLERVADKDPGCDAFLPG